MIAAEPAAAVMPGLAGANTAAVAGPRRIAFTAALLLLAAAVPSAVAGWLDDRVIQGASVWSKPLKFQLSFAVHWLTVGWLLSCIAPAAGASPWLRRWVLAGAVSAVVEVAYITLQGARGRASHFNFDTAYETVLYYGLMGGAALVMMGATLAVGIWIWRNPDAGRGPGLRLGAALGLVAGSIATLIVTAPLAAGAIDGPGPWVGGVRSNAAGLAIVGWSTTGGDLRVPHFFAAHLVQALPVAGWLADRCLPLPLRSAVLWALLAAGLIVVAATFAQAVQGAPLIAR